MSNKRIFIPEDEIKYAKFVVLPSKKPFYSFKVTDLDTAKSLEDELHPILYWSDNEENCRQWAYKHRWIIAFKTIYESCKKDGGFISMRAPLAKVKITPEINNWKWWITQDDGKNLLLYPKNGSNVYYTLDNMKLSDLEPNNYDHIFIPSEQKEKEPDTIDSILKRLDKLEKEVEELKHDGEDFKKYTFGKWSEICDEKLTFEEAMGFRDFAQANGWLAENELATKKEWNDRLRDYIHKIK